MSGFGVKKDIRGGLALLLSLCMLIGLIPINVFATSPVAISVVAESGDNDDSATSGDTITITFADEVTLDDSDWENDITVSGSGSFGDAATIELLQDNKTLVITLGGVGIDVEIGDDIEFANDAIIDAVSSDPYNDTIAITGSFAPVLASISFTATAICTNVSTLDGAADTIVLVFGAPTNGFDIIGSLELSGANTLGSSTGGWGGNNTIYTITLESDANVANGATIAFLRDNMLTSASGVIIDDVPPTEIKGNFEGAGTLIAPSEFTATIVKKATKALAQTGDEIVLVFNSPIKNTAGITPDVFNAALDNATGSFDSTNTIYTITLTAADADVVDGLTLTYVTLTDNLRGSFGTPVAPSVLRALAVDVDGTAATAGDTIIVSFDRITNKTAGTSENTFTGVLAGSTGVWDNAQTLTITLGTAAIAITDTINLSNLNIKDETGTLSALNTNGIVLQGSFGITVAPSVLRALAIDIDGTSVTAGDKIVVSLSCITNKTAGTSENTFTGVLAGSTGVWDDAQTLTITLGTAAIAITDTIDLSNLNIKDETGKLNAVGVSGIVLSGSFGASFAPEVVRAVAVSMTGSGKASQGDIIKIVFNMEVERSGVGVTPNNGNLGAGSSIAWADENGVSILTITLGNNPLITLGTTTLSLTGTIKDKISKSLSCVNPSFISVSGSFGTVITTKPQLLSVTAVSKSGSGVSRQGDLIRVVFNTLVDSTGTTISVDALSDLGTGFNPVWSNENDVSVLTIELGDNPNIKPNTSRLTINNPIKDLLTGTQICDNASNVTIGGSFGSITEPEIVGVFAVSKTGNGVSSKGDIIKVIFNTRVDYSGVTSVSTNGGFGNYSTTWETVSNVTILTITLGDGANIVPGTNTLSFNGSIKDINGIVNCSRISNLTIEGSFGEAMQLAILNAIAYVERVGNIYNEKIKVTFNIPTNKASVVAEQIKVNGENKMGSPAGAEWVSDTSLVITLGKNHQISKGDELDFSAVTGLYNKGTQNLGLNISTIEVAGELTPVVTSVVATQNSIIISFSARTNGATNLAGLSSLLGLGATAAWNGAMTEITITLGQNYTITNNGSIVINGFGIKDGFSNTIPILGQYKITTGSFTIEKLTVSKAVAHSNVKTSTVAKEDDVITIKFDSSTNLKGKLITDTLLPADVNAIIAVDGGNAKLGIGYSGKWVYYDTLQIILGDSPTIEIGDTITVSGLSFANGEGLMESSDLTLSGSFDGREFILKDATMTRTGAGGTTGDYRVTVTVENTMLKNVIPAVVCEAFNNKTPVIITRVSMDIKDSATISFDLSGSSNVTSAKIYVFDALFADITATPEVLAETLEVK